MDKLLQIKYIQNEDANLEEAVLCNTKIGVALHDAAIGCWNSKYYYNVRKT
ncbi:MAG: hypothetical protein IPJ39_21070 [Saprospiraceae bacterium]|nr:hypothetical protein [Saprospiraceae bacterium]